MPATSRGISGGTTGVAPTSLSPRVIFRNRYRTAHMDICMGLIVIRCRGNADFMTSSKGGKRGKDHKKNMSETDVCPFVLLKRPETLSGAAGTGLVLQPSARTYITLPLRLS